MNKILALFFLFFAFVGVSQNIRIHQLEKSKNGTDFITGRTSDSTLHINEEVQHDGNDFILFGDNGTSLPVLKAFADGSLLLGRGFFNANDGTMNNPIFYYDPNQSSTWIGTYTNTVYTNVTCNFCRTVGRNNFMSGNYNQFQGQNSTISSSSSQYNFLLGNFVAVNNSSFSQTIGNQISLDAANSIEYSILIGQVFDNETSSLNIENSYVSGLGFASFYNTGSINNSNISVERLSLGGNFNNSFINAIPLVYGDDPALDGSLDHLSNVNGSVVNANTNIRHRISDIARSIIIGDRLKLDGLNYSFVLGENIDNTGTGVFISSGRDRGVLNDISFDFSIINTLDNVFITDYDNYQFATEIASGSFAKGLRINASSELEFIQNDGENEPAFKVFPNGSFSSSTANPTNVLQNQADDLLYFDKPNSHLLFGYFPNGSYYEKCEFCLTFGRFATNRGQYNLLIGNLSSIATGNVFNSLIGQQTIMGSGFYNRMLGGVLQIGNATMQYNDIIGRNLTSSGATSLTMHRNRLMIRDQVSFVGTSNFQGNLLDLNFVQIEGTMLNNQGRIDGRFYTDVAGNPNSDVMVTNVNNSFLWASTHHVDKIQNSTNSFLWGDRLKLNGTNSSFVFGSNIDNSAATVLIMNGIDNSTTTTSTDPFFIQNSTPNKAVLAYNNGLDFATEIAGGSISNGFKINSDGTFAAMDYNGVNNRNDAATFVFGHNGDGQAVSIAASTFGGGGGVTSSIFDVAGEGQTIAIDSIKFNDEVTFRSDGIADNFTIFQRVGVFTQNRFSNPTAYNRTLTTDTDIFQLTNTATMYDRTLEDGTTRAGILNSDNSLYGFALPDKTNGSNVFQVETNTTQSNIGYVEGGTLKNGQRTTTTTLEFYENNKTPNEYDVLEATGTNNEFEIVRPTRVITLATHNSATVGISDVGALAPRYSTEVVEVSAIIDGTGSADIDIVDASGNVIQNLPLVTNSVTSPTIVPISYPDVNAPLFFIDVNSTTGTVTEVYVTLIVR